MSSNNEFPNKNYKKYIYQKSPNTYNYKISENSQINRGGYIYIDNRLNKNNMQAAFAYFKNHTIKVEIPFVTTTLDKGDVASSVTVTDEDGNPFTDKDGNVLVDDSGRPFARTLRESTVNIDAEGKDGYRRSVEINILLSLILTRASHLVRIRPERWSLRSLL